jgi:hypothetical protein
MSSLTKSLEKRIEELKASISSQQAELAAYEKVLASELAPSTPSTAIGDGTHPVSTLTQASSSLPSGPTSIPPFAGNRSAFVAAIVQAHGSSGVTAKDVKDIFAESKVKASQNLVYNALTGLVKQKKIDRRDGRYFSRVKASGGKTAATKKKRHVSAASREKMAEASRNRWAKKRAAESKQTKTTAKKPKSASKATGKKAIAKKMVTTAEAA